MPPAYGTVYANGVIPTPAGSHSVSQAFTGTTALGETRDVTPSGAGDTIIAVPSTATFVLVVPPPTNTVALKYREVAGDTGSFISPTQACIKSFDPANRPANLYLNAAGALTAAIEVTFW